MTQGGPTREGGDDAELVRRFARGEDGACGEVYDRHGRALYALLVRQGLDRAVAEELLQEVLLRAWQHAAAYDPERGTLRLWLMGIAHNVGRNELRRRGRRPEGFPAGDDGEDDVLLAFPDPSPGPEESAWAAVRRRDLRRAVATLSPAQQSVVWLYADGYTQSEIANALGEPLGTVKSRLRTAFRLLRLGLGTLADDDDDPDDA